MTELIEYPTAWEIATAIVAAVRIRGEDALDTVAGVLGMRGRWYAFVALHRAFPSAPFANLALIVGMPKATAVQAKDLMGSYSRKTWWRASELKVVSAALAAAIAASDDELWAQLEHKDDPERAARIERMKAQAKPRRAHRRVKPPLVETSPIELPALPVQSQTIYDRGAETEKTDLEAEAQPTTKSEQERQQSRLDLTVEDLRGLPPELIAELGPEAQALAASIADEKRDTPPAPVSPATQALAAFQRSRVEVRRIPIAERVAEAQRQENIRRANVPSAGSGFDVVGDIHMRPNRPGERDHATPLPPQAYGDPDPSYRARRAEADLRMAEHQEKVRQTNAHNYARDKEAHAEDEE